MKLKIPFYVVCFNRIKGLRSAVDFAHSSSVPLELVVLDMGSTWEPFLDFRDSLGLRIEKFTSGFGPRDLWTSGEIKKLGTGPFFLSDGDLDYTGLPTDTAAKVKSTSDKYPWFPKVGLALQISDLPNDKEGARVLKWERDNWKVKLSKDLYLNGVDTTFAYYPRREDIFYYRPSLRLAGPHTARHYPWYERNDLTDSEALFYSSVAHSKISSTREGKSPSKKYRVKHNLLLLLLFFLKIPIKFKLTGNLCVRTISYQGKILPGVDKVKSN